MADKEKGGAQLKDLLQGVNSPLDLKALSNQELQKLSQEIREFMIDTVSKTGGHLSSNLGVVELTIALHKEFDSPNDRIIWDVGHQCYTHKILTGRRDSMINLRQYGGISGFPKEYESEHDCFLCGHSSTSLSAAYGIAEANLADGLDNYVIAVIGDGALTGGQAYEALNTLGRSQGNVIVVINNNGMSISKNKGGLSLYLSSLRSSSDYLNFKRGFDRSLEKLPGVGKGLNRVIGWGKKVIKTSLYHSSFFEELGFVYYGCVDGHNIKRLSKTFNDIKNIKRPVVVQVITKKGKGYTPAEENPGGFHGVSKFSLDSGNPDIMDKESYSEHMGQALTSLANDNKDIYAITAAMKYATGLSDFCTAHKDRFFDVGIAEQHAVTLAAGLASRGKIPVFAVYSTFLQRAIDQTINDCAVNNKHIVLAVDRAGIVGEDGETHNGIFDIPLLSVVPNVKIYSPEGYDELEFCLKKAVLEDTGISAVRYPRGKPIIRHSLPLNKDCFEYSYIKDDSRSLVISYGREFSQCYEAVQSLKKQGEYYDMIKLLQIVPIPKAVVQIALQYKKIYFAEECVRTGGIGMQLLSLLAEQGYEGSFKVRAIDKTILPHGAVEVILSDIELTADKLVEFFRS